MIHKPDLALRLTWECECISRQDVQALDAEARKLFHGWLFSQPWVSFRMAESRSVWDSYFAEDTDGVPGRGVHLLVQIIPEPGAETIALAVRDKLAAKPVHEQGELEQLQSWLAHGRSYSVTVERPQIVEAIQQPSGTL